MAPFIYSDFQGKLICDKISSKKGNQITFPTAFPVKLFLELPNPSAHSPLSGYSPMTRSVLRGKRFVEKFLDTGKKVAPLRCANPHKKRNRSTPEALFCLSPPDLNSFHALYLPEPVGTSPC